MENINLNKILTTLLTEGSRDNMLLPYLQIMKQKGVDMSLGQFKQLLMTKFVTEANIHSLSLGSNFYLCGVARYYFDGVLTTTKTLGIFKGRTDKFNREICQRLDALIVILRNAHIDSVGTKWEQPEDFGELSIDKLLKKYNKVINKELGIETSPKKEEIAPKEKISKSVQAGRNYDYEIIYSYEQCKKYNTFTTPGAWCITYGKQHYDGYIRSLKIHYVIFRKKGYEEVPRSEGKDYPRDTYGSSLIAVLQSDKNPEPIYITSRWNHGGYDSPRCEADHAYTKEQFLNVIGCDESVLQRCFDQWKENVEKNKENGKNKEDRKEIAKKKLETLRYLKYAQMMINGGANPSDYINVKRVIYGNAEKPFKGIIIGTAYVNGDRECQFIVDRKQIIFESITEENWGHDWQCSLKGDRMFYYLLNVFDRKPFILYDIKSHKLLNVDGTYKFNYTTIGEYGQTMKYGIVGLTQNQQALIDLETGKVVRTPRGDCWFEDIKGNNRYSSSVRYDTFKDGEVIEMVYDSASQEKYLFQTKTKEFLNNELNSLCIDGWGITDTNYTLFEKEVGYVRMSKVIRTEKHTRTWYDGSQHEYEYNINAFKYYNTITKQFFSFQGVDTFDKVEKKGDIFAFEPFDSKQVFFYNTLKNKIVEFDGKPFIGNGGNDYCWLGLNGDDDENRMVFLDTNCQRKNNTSLCYIPEIDYFYHDDINGYFFNIYGKHNGVVTVYKNKEDKYQNSSTDTDKYNLPKAQEIIDMVTNKTKDVKDDFTTLFEKITRR